MRTSTLLATANLALLAHCASTDAPIVDNQPANVGYTAQLPASDATSLRGMVTGRSSATGGRGLTFTVTFSRLPSSGGPFLYHIHEHRVDGSGNCNSTLAHLDPYGRGETPPCDSAAPGTCQVGDLSGKHGSVTAGADGGFSASYEELYVAARTDDVAFFGDRSLTVHFANKSRIACADFEEVKIDADPSATATPFPPLAGSNGTSGGGAATGTGGAGGASGSVMPSKTATAGPTQFTAGVEGRLVAGGLAVGAALGAAAMML